MLADVARWSETVSEDKRWLWHVPPGESLGDTSLSRYLVEKTISVSVRSRLVGQFDVTFNSYHYHNPLLSWRFFHCPCCNIFRNGIKWYRSIYFLLYLPSNRVSIMSWDAFTEKMRSTYFKITWCSIVRACCWKFRTPQHAQTLVRITGQMYPVRISNWLIDGAIWNESIIFEF